MAARSRVASDNQVEAFQTALAPVEATIIADPTSKSLVADLRAAVKDLPRRCGGGVRASLIVHSDPCV